MAYKYFVGQIASDYNTLGNGKGSYEGVVTTVGQNIQKAQVDYAEALNILQTAFTGDVLAASTNSITSVINSLNGAIQGINLLLELIRAVEVYYKMLEEIKKADEQNQEYIKAALEEKKEADSYESKQNTAQSNRDKEGWLSEAWWKYDAEIISNRNKKDAHRKNQKEFEKKSKELEAQLEEMVKTAGQTRTEIISQDSGYSYNYEGTVPESVGGSAPATGATNAWGLPNWLDSILRGTFSGLYYNNMNPVTASENAWGVQGTDVYNDYSWWNPFDQSFSWDRGLRSTLGIGIIYGWFNPLKAPEVGVTVTENPAIVTSYAGFDPSILTINQSDFGGGREGGGGETAGAGAGRYSSVASLAATSGPVKLNGIDVSKHQGNIDWDKVKASGKVDYAMLKAYGLYGVDERFVQNAEACQRVGMPMGTYVYSYAKTEQQAKAEVAGLLKTISPYDFDYPVVIDMEEYVGNKSMNDTLVKICKIECDAIKEAGYKPAIYASESWLTKNEKALAGYDKWVADWGKNDGTPRTSGTKYSGDYGIWQYTSNGSVPGISGNVDMNIAYVDYSSK